jgi:ABC-type arginine transport system ATPase subunit
MNEAPPKMHRRQDVGVFYGEKQALFDVDLDDREAVPSPR